MDFRDWPIADIALVASEVNTDENGAPIYCIYSQKLDAVTFVDEAQLATLRSRGLSETSVLPED